MTKLTSEFKYLDEVIELTMDVAANIDDGLILQLDVNQKSIFPVDCQIVLLVKSKHSCSCRFIIFSIIRFLPALLNVTKSLYKVNKDEIVVPQKRKVTCSILRPSTEFGKRPSFGVDRHSKSIRANRQEKFQLKNEVKIFYYSYD